MVQLLFIIIFEHFFQIARTLIATIYFFEFIYPILISSHLFLYFFYHHPNL